MKMAKKSIYIFITLSLSLAVPFPARFAIGCFLVILLNLLMFSSTMFRYVISLFKLNELSDIFVIAFMIFITMLYKQIIAAISPETAIQLGFLIFLPVVSSFFIGYIFGEKPKTISEDLEKNMSHTMIYSLFALLLFLIRDIFGFGTFTYITFSGIKEIVIFSSTKTSTFTFLATIPGALVCTALMLSLYIFLMNKMHIVGRTVSVNAEGVNE